MTGQNNKTVRESLDRVELSNKPTLIITEEFKKKIDFLHKKVGGNEWSGELITREEGCITDLDDWKIICEDIFLVDVGSPGYTSYEVDKGSFKSADIIELYEQFPELEEGNLKLQHIHTHHSMGAFFSGTDWENLEDRAATSNYFLMLIVNFEGKYCAKVAYKSVQKGSGATRLEFANNVDGFKPLELKGKGEKNVLVVMDCKIEIAQTEIEVDSRFKARYDAVVETQKKEEEEKKKKYTSGGGFSGVRGRRGTEEGVWKNGKFYPDAWSGGEWEQGLIGFGEYWEDVEDDSVGSEYEWVQEGKEWVRRKKGEKKKEKKISEMTDKEWTSTQGVDKFDIRHAKAFLNSILYGTYLPDNFNDCIAKIEGDNKKLPRVADLEQYLEDFEDNIQEHFDVLWPGATIEQYCELLECVKEYLLPYKYNRLVSEMLDSVEGEINITSNV